MSREKKTDVLKDVSVSSGAAFQKAGISSGTAGVAVLTRNAVDQLVPQMEEYLGHELAALAASVDKIHKDNLKDLRFHERYVKVKAEWDELSIRIEAARKAYRLYVAPLRKQLEQDKSDAQKFGTWLTFERSAEMSKLLTAISSRAAEDEAVKELLAEQVALKPKYEKAEAWFKKNAERKVARQQQKLVVTK